jgi:hypothetical protein
MGAPGLKREVLFEAEKLRVHVVRCNRVGAGDDGGEDWVVVLIKTCENVGN